MRGVQVGRVSQVGTAKDGARLTLEIDPDQLQYIPANVEAEIDVTTAFGAKFVDLVYPENPAEERLAAGAVLHSTNVSTEVNTVFENVVDLLEMIDPAKLNAVLTAVADAVRGQGERIGQATTDLNEVLTALNDRSETHPRGLALVQEVQRHLRGGRPGHPDRPGRCQHHQHHRRRISRLAGQLAAQRHWLLRMRGPTCSPPARTISSQRPTFSSPPRTCCSSTAPPTPACCRARRSTWRTGATRCLAAETAVRSF